MEIIGIGTEIVECVRIARMIEQHGELFLGTVFTPGEMRRCRQDKKTTERFAAQWAAKEAVLKALGIASVKKLAWTDLEIEDGVKGRAVVRLQGAVKDQAQKQEVREILVSMAHTRAYATAYAIAVKG